MRKLLLVLGTVLSVSSALAHNAPTGWPYDPYCCSGIDCAPIKQSAVKIRGNIYVITLGVGDHPMLTRSHEYTLPISKARQSQDDDYHICFYPDENTLRCFYAPPMSF